MLPKEMRCREAADAGAHHNKIVNFLSVGGCGGGLPECAIAKTMGGFKRAGMASTKTRQLRRVIVSLARLFSLRGTSYLLINGIIIYVDMLKIGIEDISQQC